MMEGDRWKPGMFSTIVLPVCALVIAPLVAAHALNDPPRPPVAILSSVQGDTGAAASPALQSVMISPARILAISSGELVKLGDKFGDARVVKITAHEVVLRSTRGTEILHKYPDVDMKADSSAFAAGK